jgi:hypothetical protein
MIHRRAFFKRCSAAWVSAPGFAQWTPRVAGLCAAWQARKLVRGGAIGRVAFCRASDADWLSLARQVCAEGRVIAEVDRAEKAAEPGAVFLGSHATLVVGRKGCRLLP